MEVMVGKIWLGLELRGGIGMVALRDRANNIVCLTKGKRHTRRIYVHSCIAESTSIAR